MKKTKGNKLTYFSVLLALAAFTLVFQLGAFGVQADTDKDGITETAAITLPTGISLAVDSNIRTLPVCTAGFVREKCIDPATNDLFVIMQRAATSNIPMPPYDTTTKLNPLALVGPGLGVTTHELTQTAGSSQAIGNYYAVKVIEDLTTTSPYMGFSTFGTFPTLPAPGYTGGVATVWTEKIKTYIDDTCKKATFKVYDKKGLLISTTDYFPSTSNSFICKNATSGTTVNMKSPIAELITKLNREFIQNIVSHEVSHMIHLASATGTVDHHYPIATGTLMEQFINAKATKDANLPPNIVVTLYISTGYAREDKSQYWLINQ